MVTEKIISVKIGAQTMDLLSIEWQLIGPKDAQPEPSTPESTVISTPIEIDGVKFWIEWRPL